MRERTIEGDASLKWMPLQSKLNSGSCITKIKIKISYQVLHFKGRLRGFSLQTMNSDQIYLHKGKCFKEWFRIVKRWTSWTNVINSFGADYH